MNTPVTPSKTSLLNIILKSKLFTNIEIAMYSNINIAAFISRNCFKNNVYTFNGLLEGSIIVNGDMENLLVEVSSQIIYKHDTMSPINISIAQKSSLGLIIDAIKTIEIKNEYTISEKRSLPLNIITCYCY
ncbi:hypothetical protein [Natronoflexus pectinivorans]|uniref:hypothetical protein n=1 Tax=Natronoflexus pectinivorans TaxID=682526 RepID=UPI001051C044|nr:hypothetical protein [Natronoflexus pectinivorans]